MQAGHGGRQVQPEARAVPGRRVGEAHEGLHGPRAVPGRYARSRIRHRNDQPAIRNRRPQLHAPAGRRELQGVVDEVGDGLGKQLPVAEHEAVRRAADGERDALLLRLGLVQLAKLVEHEVERHRLRPRADRAALGLRDLQQRREHALHLVHVAQ